MDWRGGLRLPGVDTVLGNTRRYLQTLGFLTFLYITLSTAWNILGGYAGQTSFGHATFYGLGAYTTSILALRGIPALLTLPIAGMVASFYAFLWGYPCLRLRGQYFAIATIGVGEATRLLMLNLDDLIKNNPLLKGLLQKGVLTGGATGLMLPTPEDIRAYATSSPLNTVCRWPELFKRRRTLGVYAFLYATLHVMIFVNLDYGLAWSLIAQTVFEKPYILVGVISFLLLIPLAATSFDVWKMRLKKNWKRLHMLVYLIAPLIVLHYGWSKKGDFFALQGEIIRPLIYGPIVALPLVLRIHPVRRSLASLRDRILNRRIRRRLQQEA